MVVGAHCQLPIGAAYHTIGNVVTDQALRFICWYLMRINRSKVADGEVYGRCEDKKHKELPRKSSTGRAMCSWHRRPRDSLTQFGCKMEARLYAQATRNSFQHADDGWFVAEKNVEHGGRPFENGHEKIHGIVCGVTVENLAHDEQEAIY